VPRLVDSLTPLIDQTMAGAVLMILGKATLAVAAISVFVRWFGEEHSGSPRAPVLRLG
jgi:cytochrome c oxidase assembly factor CtaG